MYRDMVQKGVDKDKDTAKAFNAQKLAASDEEQEDSGRMGTCHLNASARLQKSSQMFAKVGIFLMVLSLFPYLLIAAFLPFFLTIFCIFAPIALLTEVLGVLTVAVMQSFDPIYEIRMSKEIHSKREKKGIQRYGEML